MESYHWVHGKSEKQSVALHWLHWYQESARFYRENVLTEEFKDSGDSDGVGFQFEKCTNDEVIKIVENIKSNAGVEGVDLKIFKAIRTYILPFILQIINLSLETGTFPEGLKQAKIIPLYKGGTRSDAGN